MFSEIIPRPIQNSLSSGLAMMDDGKRTWNEIIKPFLKQPSKIVALRGAGSWNGMDKREIDELLTQTLIPRIEKYTANATGTLIMHDGDYDDPTKPDLGYVAGRMLDYFGNGTDNVIFLVAQKESWHPDDLQGRNLKNANGLQYATYLFPDNKYEGDHSSFTQDQSLVHYSGYEQWYVGASGQIADSQLTDYDSKVPERSKRKAVLFRVGNNAALNNELQLKIGQAESEGNINLVEALGKRVTQRKRVYGTHWNNSGEPDLIVNSYPRLDFEFVS